MNQASEDLVVLAQNFIAWALLVVLAVSILALGGNRPVVWSLMCIAILALFCGQILVDMVRPRPRPLDRLWLPALLFLSVLTWGLLQRSLWLPASWAHPAWEMVSSTPGRISADPVRSGYGVMRLGAYAMVFWIAVRAGEARENVYLYLRAFALFSTGLAIFGFYCWITGQNPILSDLASGNLSASFVNRNNYATFAAFGFFANLAIYARISRNWQKVHGTSWRASLEGFFSSGWFWAFGMLICAGAMVATQSRAGVLAGAIGLLMFIAAFRAGQQQSSRNILLVASGTAIGVGLTASMGLVDRLLSTSDEEGRFLVFPFVLEGIGDRLWLGHGLGAFADAFRVYVPPAAATGEWDMAHNSYLENLFELGIPASCALYLALALIVLRLWRGILVRKRARSILSFVLACVATATFHAALDFSFQMPALTACFTFVLGIGYAQSFPEDLMKRAGSRPQAREVIRSRRPRPIANN